VLKGLKLAPFESDPIDSSIPDGAYSLSIGIAQTGPDTFLAAEDFVPEADTAMYESKKNTGSQITIHQPADACLHVV